MRNRFIKVLLFTLALTLLALSFCALAYADGIRVYAPSQGVGGPASSHGFDVIGSVGGMDVPSTAGNSGFRTYLRIEDGSPVLLAGNNQFYFDQEYGTEDVRVYMTASTGFSGRAAIIDYVVTNISPMTLKVSIGSCGDTQVGGNSGSGIFMGGQGFVSEAGNLSLLVFPGADTFSNAWCGSASLADSNVFSRRQEAPEGQNNGLAWSWVAWLQPGQSMTRQVVIAIGNQGRCNVRFHPNGGEGQMQERLTLAGCDYQLPENRFERGGYRFVGWSASEEAEEINYLDGGTVPASDVYDGMILYAVWEDKARQTVEAEDLTIEFGESARLTASSSDGRISFAVKTGSDVIDIDPESGWILAKKVGQAKVTVTAAATHDSHPAEKDVLVTVNPKTLDRSMLTLTPDKFSYTGKPQRPTLSVQHGERKLVQGRDYTIDDSSVLSATALGEYRISVTGAGNYTGSASAVWTIEKFKPSVTVTAYSGTYDGKAHPLVSVSAHTGGTLQYAMSQNGPFSTAIPEAAAAGSYTVWTRIAGDETWQDMAPIPRTAVIGRREVTVSGITAADKIYDGSTRAELVFDTAVITGLYGGDDVTVRSASGMFADANVGQDKHVSVSAITLGGDDAQNYSLAPQKQQTETTGSIEARPLTVKAKDQSIRLYGKINTACDQAEAEGLCSYDTLYSVTLTGTSSEFATTAGTVTASNAVIVRRGSTQRVTDNYTLTYMPGVLTVEQVELKLTWSNTEFEYDGKSHRPNATVTGTLGGEILTVNVTGAEVAANPEGEKYTATASSLSGRNAGNYKLPEEATQTFVITPRSLEADEITVDYRPGDEPSIIGPVPADGKAYGFRSIVVKDGTRTLVKDVDYRLDSNYSTIFGPHTLHIIGMGNYKDSLSRDWTLIGDGMLTASVEVKNGGANVYWNNASEALADSLLDESDRDIREEYGAPTDVYLQIRPAVITSGVAAKASQIGEVVGANYDLTLFKRVGNTATAIHDTGGRPISITFDVPEELRKAPVGYYRSFSLIHLNNGTAEVLGQGTGSSFTFTTTSFSAYAISYRDIELPPTASPPTGDNAKLPLWSALLLLSMGALLCLQRKKKTI